MEVAVSGAVAAARFWRLQQREGAGVLTSENHPLWAAAVAVVAAMQQGRPRNGGMFSSSDGAAAAAAAAVAAGRHMFFLRLAVGLGAGSEKRKDLLSRVPCASAAVFLIRLPPIFVPRRRLLLRRRSGSPADPSP
jgi:hypothetical protein